MSNLIHNKVFMFMQLHSLRYMGFLGFDDPTFCLQIFDLLKANKGRPIKEIGDLYVGASSVNQVPFPMQLRDHPLMSYRGVCNWPPTWVKSGSSSDVFQNKLYGEIGVLDQVLKFTPYTRCYLIIEVEGESYMGTLLFEDAAFCRQVFKLLQNQVSKPIKEIGDLDVSYLL